MKKVITYVLFLLLILTCFGCSNNSNNQSQSSQSNSDSSTSSESSTNSSTSINNIVGDWQYLGDINGTTYDISLDLENDNQFDLNVEEENREDDVEAEMEGTYTASDGILTLDVVTLQNNSDYFTGKVVQNAQLELKYNQKDDNTLELTNMNDVISFIPAELTLTRDK